MEEELKLAEKTSNMIKLKGSVWKYFMLKDYKDCMEFFESGVNEPRMEQLYRVQNKMRKLKEELS